MCTIEGFPIGRDTIRALSRELTSYCVEDELAGEAEHQALGRRGLNQTADLEMESTRWILKLFLR